MIQYLTTHIWQVNAVAAAVIVLYNVIWKLVIQHHADQELILSSLPDVWRRLHALIVASDSDQVCGTVGDFLSKNYDSILQTRPLKGDELLFLINSLPFCTSCSSIDFIHDKIRQYAMKAVTE